MRGSAWLGIVLAACGASDPLPRAPIEEPDAPSMVEDAPVAPWGLVRVRPCGPRGGFGVLVTSAHAHGCGAIFTRDGALVTAARLPHNTIVLGSAGDRVLVQRSEWVDDAHVTMDLAVLGADLRRVGERMAFDYVQSAAPGSGSEVLFSTPTMVAALDLANGGLRTLDDRCAGADAVGFVEGGVACVVTPELGPPLLIAPGQSDHTLPAFTVFSFAGERLVGANDQGLLVMDLDGTTRHLALSRARVLDVRDEQVLISSVGSPGEALRSRGAAPLRSGTSPGEHSGLDRDAGVALVDLDTLVVEQVLPTQADDGAFAGEDLIVESQGALLWLARGATHVRPWLEVPTPAGLVRLADVPGEQWGDEERALPWSYGDIAAFVSGERTRDGIEHTVEVIVSVSEASELASFDDDAWARALFHRFLPIGEDVWVRAWRDEEGHRVMRGHVWVGGCGRTHYDVRVRELGERLERYEVHTNARAHARADVILGRMPRSAVQVLDDAGAYVGDPSMGTL